jgi:site-specific DNA recombinase
MRDVTAATLLEETQLISDMIQQSTYENALVALDQAEFQKRYDSLTNRFDTAKEHLETVMVQLQQMQL